MPQNGHSAPPPALEEFRAAWVATVDNIDYPSKPGLPVSQMKAEMDAILNRCAELNMNAIIFQVRPSADALYQSSYEPWSWYLTGQQGKAPEGGFDPLEYTIAESHKRGIEVHVWLNPYRALHPAQTGPVTEDHISVTAPNAVKKYGRFLWMDPGEKVIQDRSFNVFMELVEKYDLDGIHIDDYFYPYPVTEAGKKVDFPDDPSWNAYVRGGGRLSRGDWRRKNVDDFVKRVHEGVKKRKSWVKFGISPFGIYRPGVPEGIAAGIDQYDELYADALKWYREGWCDYFTPQLYWPIAQTKQSFPVLLNWWASQNPKKIHLWPGQFTSRTNPNDGNWLATEVTDQIKLVRDHEGATGTVHFSMKAIQRNWNGIGDALQKAYATPAVVPPSPWMKAPNPGKLEVTFGSPQGQSVAWLQCEVAKPDAVRFYLYRDSEGRFQRTSASQVRAEKVSTGWLTVQTIDKAGRISEPAKLEGLRLNP